MYLIMCEDVSVYLISIIMNPTLGLTPGIDRVRKPLDMYSPLPSQPWPGREWIDR